MDSAVRSMSAALMLGGVLTFVACSPAPPSPTPTQAPEVRATLAAQGATAPTVVAAATSVLPAPPTATPVPPSPTPVPPPEIETPVGRFRVLRAAIPTFRPFVMGQPPIPAGKQEVQIDLELVAPLGVQPVGSPGGVEAGASPSPSPSPGTGGAIGAMMQLLPFCSATVYVTTDRDDRVHCSRVTTSGLGELTAGTPIGLVFLVSTGVPSLTLVVPEGPAIPLEIAAEVAPTPAVSSPAAVASPAASPRP